MIPPSSSMQMFAHLPTAECFWNFENCYLYVQVKQFKSAKEFKSDLLQQTQLLEQKNGRKILFEVKPRINLTIEDQFYISHIFLPEMIKKGLKYLAIVSSNFNLYNQLFIQNIAGRFESTLMEVRIFKKFEDAENWLDHQ